MASQQRVVIASGYYDPIHTGHIEYLELAKQYAVQHDAKLAVIVNNNMQAENKKGKPFMCESERLTIVMALRCVDIAMISIDNDRSVCESINKLACDYKVVAFAKGGDRFATEVPEAVVCNKYNIPIVDGLGLKIQSSSALLAAAGDASAPTPLPKR